LEISGVSLALSSSPAPLSQRLEWNARDELGFGASPPQASPVFATPLAALRCGVAGALPAARIARLAAPSPPGQEDGALVPFNGPARPAQLSAAEELDLDNASKAVDQYLKAAVSARAGTAHAVASWQSLPAELVMSVIDQVLAARGVTSPTIRSALVEKKKAQAKLVRFYARHAL